MKSEFLSTLQYKTQALKENGLYKEERIILSPQQTTIQIQSANPVINLCANNYLGLANHPDIVRVANESLNTYGYGMSSVRFICGTQIIHKILEKKISQYLKTEDTILYSSCFDANTGLFETLFDEEDAIISDTLNHASIIDGIRLCKAKRLRYANNDMADLEQKLKEADSARYRLIATDGVFSMDGTLANLSQICYLAKQYDALVMVDDSHGVGVMGSQGRGTPDHWKVSEQVDIVTGTLGKALGGASGGYTSGRQEIISWLRQRSRPYLFSNTLAPMIVATSIKVLELLQENLQLQEQLHQNAAYFRSQLTELGFNLIPGNHPIIPIMLFDANVSSQMAEALLKEGVYVISFSYPVVPNNQARIRTQLSASHTKKELDQALLAFQKVGKLFKVIR